MGKEDMKLGERARAFATERHLGQTYGDGKPYTVHLEAVAKVIQETTPGGELYIACAWLHDVIEDTETTREEVSRKFDPFIADIVFACSGFGKNRKERNADIYSKIRRSRSASIVKVADRIANLEASEPGGSHAGMYLNERSAFLSALYYPMPTRLMNRLTAAYSRLSSWDSRLRVAPI